MQQNRRLSAFFFSLAVPPSPFVLLKPSRRQSSERMEKAFLIHQSWQTAYLRGKQISSQGRRRKRIPATKKLVEMKVCILLGWLAGCWCDYDTDDVQLHVPPECVFWEMWERLGLKEQEKMLPTVLTMNCVHMLLGICCSHQHHNSSIIGLAVTVPSCNTRLRSSVHLIRWHI